MKYAREKEEGMVREWKGKDRTGRERQESKGGGETGKGKEMRRMGRKGDGRRERLDKDEKGEEGKGG